MLERTFFGKDFLSTRTVVLLLSGTSAFVRVWSEEPQSFEVFSACYLKRFLTRDLTLPDELGNFGFLICCGVLSIYNKIYSTL